MNIGRSIAALLAALLCTAAASRAEAHRFAPAVLELDELGAGRVEMRWTVGLAAPSALRPHLGPRCKSVGLASSFRGPRARVTRRAFDCGPRGLAGLTITVGGRDEARTDVVVRLRRAAVSARETFVLRADTPSLALLDRSRRRRAADGLAGFVGLGFAHILGGIDHVLLVLALLAWTALRQRTRRARVRELAATVSAFTVGHSVTLLLSTVALLDIPPRPAEACIALSLVIIAAEVLRASHAIATPSTVLPSTVPLPIVPPSTVPCARSGLWRRPWLLALAFGLLHGLGFAGALRELALPDAALPAALAGFNIGVELGQIAVISGALLGAQLLARLCRTPRLAPRLAAYAAGLVGAVLLFGRLSGVSLPI